MELLNSRIVVANEQGLAKAGKLSTKAQILTNPQLYSKVQ